MAEVDPVFDQAANVRLKFMDSIAEFHEFVIIDKLWLQAIDIFVDDPSDAGGFATGEDTLGLIDLLLRGRKYSLLFFFKGLQQYG